MYEIPSNNTDPAQTDPLHIYHYDLYRLTHPRELDRLELDVVLPRVLSLIEWADRLENAPLLVPRDYLSLSIFIEDTDENCPHTLLDTPEKHRKQALNRNKKDGDDHEEEGGVDDDDDGEEELGGGWRRVMLIPRGNEWIERVADLKRHVVERGDALGLFLV